MRAFDLVLGVVAAIALGGAARSAPVLMISIDGLRPADVLDAAARGISVPNLAAVVRDGAFASGVRDALPSVTYPNHTTLVTGVWPAIHDVASNTVFDPLKKNMEGWYWYAQDIKAPTLWGAVHRQGGVVASLGWPVTVGQGAIDENVPEYWRAYYPPEDGKLLAALSTPGLPKALHDRAGIEMSQLVSTEPETDDVKARAAAAIISLYHPRFFTLHLSSLDEEQHLHGPGSPEAKAALARIDTAVGALVREARQAEPDLVVAIVSDHGFAPVEHDIDIGTAFVAEGLMRLDEKGKPVAWDAAPWVSGGSCAVVLARRDDPALRAKVAGLLARLAADPNSGVGAVIDRQGIAARGGAPDADFYIDAKIGYEFGGALTGPLVAPGRLKGMHGYFPSHPEMRSTFFIAGPNLPLHGALGEIDMIDIAPTVAKILGVDLSSATGHALY